MLTVYKRHLKECGHRSRRFRRCSCPIWVQGKLHGEQIRKSLELTNWEAAQKKVREWESGEGVEIPPLSEACKRFLDDMRGRKLSKDTIRKAELLTEELMDFFPSISLARITADDLAEFREGWDASNSTARKKLERLRSFFKFCVDRDWLRKNPAKALRYPKEVDVEVKPYDKEELDKIEAAIPEFSKKGIYGEDNIDRLYAFTGILRWTGFRIRDSVMLEKIRVKDGVVTIRATKNKKPIKLLLHPSAVGRLKKLKTQGKYFFWSGFGNVKSCVGDWQRTLRRLGELAGVHVHAHRWRHTFATDLLSKGVPVSEVAAILGNSVRIVEKHYAQWIESRQTALDAAVTKAWAA